MRARRDSEKIHLNLKAEFQHLLFELTILMTLKSAIPVLEYYYGLRTTIFPGLVTPHSLPLRHVQAT
jgi:hypothetical protein